MNPTPPQLQGNGATAASASLVPRVVTSNRGAAWWGEGWRLFTRNVGMWFGIAIVYSILYGALGHVPRIGDAAEWLLSPVFAGGIILGCAALARGEPLRFAHLFEGFSRNHFVPLLIVGLINVAMAAATFAAGFVVVASVIGLSASLRLGNFMDDPWPVVEALGLIGLVLVLLGLILLTIMAMATWFAPALIVLRNGRPVDAMLASFRACLRNWAPFLVVYGTIGIGIVLAGALVFVVLLGVVGAEAIVAMYNGTATWKSFGPGLFLLAVAFVAFFYVLAIVVYTSTFAAYRDIFASGDSAPPEAA